MTSTLLILFDYFLHQCVSLPTERYGRCWKFMLYSFEEETDIAVEIKRHMRDSSTDEMDTNRYNTYVDRRTFK
jgi:hypothetical protein